MTMKLKCGDPAKGPASYTRFVLPFAYCPASRRENQSNERYYEKAKPCDFPLDDLLWRKKYLTYETSHVLFEKAKWFTLKNTPCSSSVDISFRNCGANEDITINIKPPYLVLFEWPGSRDICEKDCEVADGKQCSVDKHNVLRVGLLVVELYFPEQLCIGPSLDNLLKLNEGFRYWQRPFDGHEDETGYGELLSLGSDEAAHRISGSDMPHFERWANLLDIPIKHDCGDLCSLFPMKWMDNAKEFVSSSNVNFPGWALYSDTRTFVWTCAIMKDGALRRYFTMPGGKAWDFGYWVKLLNVDTPKENIYKTHQITDFEGEWAEKRTYKRWEESGTFYGFNYHCGAMLGPPEKEPPFYKHFGEMYFDQIILLLYNRIALFRFSMELNRISANALEEEQGDFPKWREEFQRLRWSFALFTNLYQFPLFSNQQQAIEMYSLARKYMDIDDLYKEVKAEISDCHEYLVIEEEIKQSLDIGGLTWVATILLPISVVLSFWGMNIIADSAVGLHRILQWLLVITPSALLISLLFWVIGYRRGK